MRRRPKNHRGTDRLVAESEKLRGELLKTAARVANFTEHLADDARALLEESARTNEDGCDDREGRNDPGSETGPSPTPH